MRWLVLALIATHVAHGAQEEPPRQAATVLWEIIPTMFPIGGKIRLLASPGMGFAVSAGLGVGVPGRVELSLGVEVYLYSLLSPAERRLDGFFLGGHARFATWGGRSLIYAADNAQASGVVGLRSTGTSGRTFSVAFGVASRRYLWGLVPGAAEGHFGPIDILGIPGDGGSVLIPVVEVGIGRVLEGRADQARRHRER